MASRKKPDQEWTDTELPGMDGLGVFEEPPEPKPNRHYGKVLYKRNNRMTIKCTRCALEVASGNKNSVEYAAYARSYLEEPMEYLCFLHTNEAKHQDKVAGRHYIG